MSLNDKKDSQGLVTKADQLFMTLPLYLVNQPVTYSCTIQQRSYFFEWVWYGFMSILCISKSMITTRLK